MQTRRLVVLTLVPALGAAAGAHAQWSSAAGNVYRTTGNVGVGTSAPTQKLQVISTGERAVFAQSTALSGLHYAVYGSAASPGARAIFAYSMANSGQGMGLWARTDSPTGYAGYFQGGRNYFQGNVGIGTTAPTAKLQVVSDQPQILVGSAAAAGRIYFARGGDGNATGSIGWNGPTASEDFRIQNASGSGSIQLETADGHIILSGDKVGIGTVSPTEKLHVIGNILATGTITPSSAKLKENVVPIADALERLAGLDAVRFDWKADEAKIRGFTRDLGFIAENVAEAFPEVVFRDAEGHIKGLDYSRMSAVAISAIKQLKSENDRLKAESDTMKAEVDSMKARLERLEALLAAQAEGR